MRMIMSMVRWRGSFRALAATCMAVVVVLATSEARAVTLGSHLQEVPGGRGLAHFDFDVYNLGVNPVPFSTSAASAVMVTQFLDNGVGAVTASAGDMLAWAQSNVTPVVDDFEANYPEEMDHVMLAATMNHFKPHPAYEFDVLSASSYDDAIGLLLESYAASIAADPFMLFSPVMFPLLGEYNQWVVVTGAFVNLADSKPLGFWVADPQPLAPQGHIFYSTDISVTTDPVWGYAAPSFHDIFTPMNVGPLADQWVMVGHQTSAGTTDPGGNQSGNGPGGSSDPAAVPEPATAGLLALALAALAGHRRRTIG